MPRSALQKSLVAPAGEHFVLYKIHRLGMLAALAPRNFPYADVMVVTPDGSTGALVQVKARTTGRDGGWHMSEKHERLVFPGLFYCLVDFEPSEPVTYVVPSSVVASVVRESYLAWVVIPGKDGQQRATDNKFRRLLPRHPYVVKGAPDGWLDPWKERWDLVGVAAP